MISSFSIIVVSSYFSVLLAIVSATAPKLLKTTAERIQEYGYPAEFHTVKTSDDYILTMFRIPYSPKLQNKNKAKPIAFLQHGLASSSDCWILNGPNDALAFLFADAGYDVWMANCRGNIYSRKNAHLSPNDRKFWDFSWHEIALIDLPASIDYVLDLTGQPSLYYVAHSQGTTIFFVLMSSVPSYNEKIKIGFMLSPVGYMNNMKGPPAVAISRFLGHPSTLSMAFTASEKFPHNHPILRYLSDICVHDPSLHKECANFIFLLTGFDSKYFNYTMLPDILETHPAGSSTKQYIHFFQEYLSGHFRQYDYGAENNLRRYKQLSPPDYPIENITTKVVLYYGANDWLTAIKDVKRLAKRMPNLLESNLVPIPEWNHIDSIWSTIVKPQINDKIIKIANENEARDQKGLV